MICKKWLMGAGLLLLLGCEELATEELDSLDRVGIVSETAVLEETEASIANQSKPEVDNEDIPLSSFNIALSDLVKNSKYTGNSFTVTLTNSGTEDLWVKPKLNCLGMVVFAQSVELGEHLIKAGKVRTLKISAKKLPVQSDVNALQIRAEAAFRSAVRKDDSWSVIVSPAYYYIFDAEYVNATLMSDDVMMKEHKGVSFKETGSKDNMGRRIGKVKNKDAVLEDVTAGESEAYNIIGNGKVLGYLTGGTDEIDGAGVLSGEVQ